MPSLPHYVHQGLKFVPHFFTVPLDYDDPSKGTIEIFAREVNQHGDNTTNKPWLVYFQGGPGFPAGRPMGNSGWIKRALQQYRVLLLDQRGTGNSSVISHQTLAHLTPEQQADPDLSRVVAG